ncbi:Multidrug resistance protein MdtB [Xanthomonas arboricola pv. corylina]|uniref:Multidrug resistance protein MdtB n=1 Tax=Xanthomonas arboricola pv. corylina TaxID=487821 RepID=A0A8D6UJ41_9XANT|nr:Multidrug resistance protein MdtB [Xanthomonas arboricola pv. corylina]CAE6703328.1 Multidrug resistance protein MdtB [Xanthomonas arboricola pv. corylina]CAE6703565.1 Multidrug resistance protein MdtB [Xanthomonas arboricola pv. corylina]CAE6703587.1 Multidrug resistance protein MdtB [Xanthomonas arboricola pv. corylina]CAE6705096.1 Multidrug resistance protein MdtB [Xanthomonas arboricola pv. corylina]
MSEGRFNLSALAVRERSITLFLIVLISLAGLVAFLKLGRAEDPAFTVKVMTIVTAWPGATPQEMQDQVAEKLEKRLQELRWYDRSETYTRPGLAFTTLTLLDSTPPSQVQEQFYQARKKVGDEVGNLPAGVIGPMVNDEYADVTFALFALKAKGEPQRLLARDAESLRQRMLHVPGVKKVNIIGEQPERLFVEFSHERLATLGVGPQEVFAALNAQNALNAAGSVETRGPQVFIRLDGALDSLQKIRDTPLVVQGRTLKLSDIATVKRGYEDPSTFMIRSGGEPALLLGIIMRDGWNGLDLGKSLDSEVSAINAELPLGMTLSKVTDQAVNIDASVGEFMTKFFVALLVVMLVCFVSMGWRVGIVVAAAVPLTLAAVFVVMLATGKNFDRITLGSLILALGLLVDDAIIAIEMMVVKMEEGYSRRRRIGLCVEPYRRADAVRHAGDRGRLHAERLCRLHRRRIHQQHVLDRGDRADCVVGGGSGVHALSGRQDAAGSEEDRRRPRRDVRHAALQPLPQCAGTRHRAQVAGGRLGGGPVRACDPGHGHRQEAVLPDLRSP